MRELKEILDRLKSLRKTRGIRQGEIAKELGVDRSTYVRKEQGEIPIITEEWLKIAKMLDVNPAYFF